MLKLQCACSIERADTETELITNIRILLCEDIIRKPLKKIQNIVKIMLRVFSFFYKKRSWYQLLNATVPFSIEISLKLFYKAKNNPRRSQGCTVIRKEIHPVANAHAQRVCVQMLCVYIYEFMF